MASFNKVILIGNMTADPELKQTTSGLLVCSFSIAVNRRSKSQDGNNECDFINVVAWRQTAEFVAKYFKKGNPILVCGQLQTRTWTDTSNSKRYATEVVADEISFVSSRESGTEAKNEPVGNVPYTPTGYTTSTNPNFEALPDGEGLPF